MLAANTQVNDHKSQFHRQSRIRRCHHNDYPHRVIIHIATPRLILQAFFLSNIVTVAAIVLIVAMVTQTVRIEAD